MNDISGTHDSAPKNAKHDLERYKTEMKNIATGTRYPEGNRNLKIKVKQVKLFS